MKIVKLQFELLRREAKNEFRYFCKHKERKKFKRTELTQKGKYEFENSCFGQCTCSYLTGVIPCNLHFIDLASLESIRAQCSSKNPFGMPGIISYPFVCGIFQWNHELEMIRYKSLQFSMPKTCRWLICWESFSSWGKIRINSNDVTDLVEIVRCVPKLRKSLWSFPETIFSTIRSDLSIQIQNVVANREEKLPALLISVINNEIHVDVDDEQKVNENSLKIEIIEFN